MLEGLAMSKERKGTKPKKFFIKFQGQVIGWSNNQKQARRKFSRYRARYGGRLVFKEKK